MENTKVSDLISRYQVGKTHLYQVRLDAMKRAGLGEPFKIGGNVAYINSEQLKFLDLLDMAIKDGITPDKFLSDRYQGDAIVPSEAKPKKSAIVATSDSSIDLRQLELLTAIVQRTMVNSSPLANFEALECAHKNKWRLPTAKLAALLDLRTLRGNQIERYGFRCTRIKTQGLSDEWAIEKLSD